MREPHGCGDLLKHYCAPVEFPVSLSASCLRWFSVMSNEQQSAPAPTPVYPGGYREIFRVAYPLMISMGSFTLMQFVDRMFLAWHSAVSIQAATPAGILSFTLICGFMALAGYANTFVAQYYGAGDPVGCSRSTAQGFYLSLLSLPLILMLIPFGRMVIHISGHPPEVIEEELAYFTILMIGGFTAPLGAAISSFYTGRGRTLITMNATIASNVVNLVLDYGMIFGHFGFPEMGIRGAAWASVIAGFVMPAILFTLYFARSTDAVFKTRSHFGFDAALCWRMIKYGFASGLHLALDIGAFSVFVMLTGRLGSAALAASNIALSINMLAFLPMIGISIATTTLVGQYQGRREPDISERVGWNSMKLGTLYMGLIGLTYVLFPEFYFSFFTRHGAEGVPLEELLAIGRGLLIVMAIWGLLDAANIILSAALKGAGDTKFVMYFSLALAWGVLVAGEVVLVFVLKAGIFAVWSWTCFYITLLAGGFAWRFRTGVWKHIDLLGASVPIQPDRPGAEGMVAVD